MVCFQTKMSIWVNFGGGYLIGNCSYMLWSLGIFYGDLGYFMTIWYILYSVGMYNFSCFGIMYQEKYGNPGLRVPFPFGSGLSG
jgi:hypothetical protein